MARPRQQLLLPVPRPSSHRLPTPVSETLKRFPFPLRDQVELGHVGFVTRLIVATTLPHSPPADNEFVRTSGLHDLTLLAPRQVGLPSGRYPRLVLAWMITEAVRTKSLHLSLGPSLSSFAYRLGITPTTGPRGTLVHLRDQIHRLVNVTFCAVSRPTENPRFGLAPAFSGGGVRLASAYLLWWDDPPPTPARPSFIRISQDLFDEILAHPVPIDLEVLRGFRSPLEMDVYMWLTYRSVRSSRLKRPERISWEAIERQFGSDYSELRKFRFNFLRAIRNVLKVYPAVRATNTPLGLVLHPYSSHVPRRPKKP